MEETGVIVLRILVMCGPLAFVAVVHMPTLAGLFRRRLRDRLALTKQTQTALSKHLDLDGGQVSRILKYDHAAGQVTLNRVEAIAVFVGEVPSNLVRASDDEPESLTVREREILELVRMLPDDQQQNLVAWLAYVFPERRSAAAERAVIRQLNLARQAERDRERDELHRLRKHQKK